MADQEIRKIDLNKIVKGPGLTRVPDPEFVANLARSMWALSTRNVIVVRQDGKGRYECVDGKETVAALRELGEAEAWAQIVEPDDLYAKALRLARNLNRRNIPDEARDEAIYEFVKELESSNLVATKPGRGRKGPARLAADLIGMTKQGVVKAMQRHEARMNPKRAEAQAEVAAAKADEPISKSAV